jgi:hypothetical protein
VEGDAGAQRERKVGWIVNSTLVLMNLHSQRKTKSSKNTNFLGINQARSNPCEGREDPDRLIRRERAQVVAVEGGVGVAGAGDAVEEVEARRRSP